MPQFLSLRGRNALSEFRLSKLNQALQQAHLRLSGISAEFRHFVSATRVLTNAEYAILERILTYGPAARAAAATTRRFRARRDGYRWT